MNAAQRRRARREEAQELVRRQQIAHLSGSVSPRRVRLAELAPIFLHRARFNQARMWRDMWRGLAAQYGVLAAHPDDPPPHRPFYSPGPVSSAYVGSHAMRIARGIDDELTSQEDSWVYYEEAMPTISVEEAMRALAAPGFIQVVPSRAQQLEQENAELREEVARLKRG